MRATRQLTTYDALRKAIHAVRHATPFEPPEVLGERAEDHIAALVHALRESLIQDAITNLRDPPAIRAVVFAFAHPEHCCRLEPESFQTDPVRARQLLHRWNTTQGVFLRRWQQLNSYSPRVSPPSTRRYTAHLSLRRSRLRSHRLSRL